MITYIPSQTKRQLPTNFGQKKTSGITEFIKQGLILIGIELLATAAEVLSEGALTPFYGEVTSQAIGDFIGTTSSLVGNATYYGIREDFSIGIMFPYIGRFAKLGFKFKKILNIINSAKATAKALNLTEEETNNVINSVKKLLIDFRNTEIGGFKFAFEKIEQSGEWKKFKDYINEFNQIKKEFSELQEAGLSTSDKKFSIFNNINSIKKFSNAFQRVKRFIYFISPTYATRILSEKITVKWTKLVNKIAGKNKALKLLLNPRELYLEWSNEYKKLKRKSSFNRLIRNYYKNLENDPDFIPMKSSWILGIKRFEVISKDIENVIVYFIPENTNNKQPVLLEKVNKLLIDDFILASSKGRFYLRRLAWGWEVGKYFKYLSLISNSLDKTIEYQKVITALIQLRAIYQRVYVNTKRDFANFKSQFGDEYGKRKGVMAELSRSLIRENFNIGGLVLPAYRAVTYKNPGQLLSFGSHRIKTKIRSRRSNKNVWKSKFNIKF